MKPSSLSTLLRWFGAIIGLGLLLWALGHYSKQYIVPFARWVHGLGPWGPIAFIGTYILADIVLIPATALTLVAGALFGFVAGSVYTFIGAMLGSLGAFFMGRYVVRPLIIKRLQGDDRFALVESAATQGGVRLVALVRLSPILPYTVLNYALGTTRISTRDYVIGTIAILPGTLVYTYYGTVVANLTGLTSGMHRGIALYLLVAAGVVATVAVIVIITRIAKRELGAMRGEMRGSTKREQHRRHPGS
ncbi:MAG: TVP38/TMEM64 family protein [Gemmatimonadaceae bacterium]